MIPPRTTPALVVGVLVYNYDNLRKPDLSGFIATASNIVDQVVTDAAALCPPVALDANTQELVERWLSAYFYCKMDPLKASKSTQGSSGSYVSNGSSLEGEADRYKRGAVEVDISGCLHAILNRNVARAHLLGSRRR
jgi:hypothetical protein